MSRCLFQCTQLGNNLREVVDKFKKYDDSSAGLLKWLNSAEEEARKQQSEAIAAEPQALQKQLEETKARVLICCLNIESNTRLIHICA